MRALTAFIIKKFKLYIQLMIISSSSSDNGADSIPSNITPRVNKQMCIEKAVQQTMNSNRLSIRKNEKHFYDKN